MFQPSPFPSPFPKSPYPSAISRSTSKPSQKPDGKRYINYLAGRDGCAAYRRGFLTNHLNLTGVADSCEITKMILDKNFYKDVTCITLQRQASTDQKRFMEYLKSMQGEFGFKMIYEVDDVVFREEIPDYNASKHGFDNDEVRQNCIDMINLCDEVTVTCKYMRDLYIEKTGKKEITVIPNFMPYWWIGHQFNYKQICDNLEKHKKKPRIVYAGSGAHFDMKNVTG